MSKRTLSAVVLMSLALSSAVALAVSLVHTRQSQSQALPDASDDEVGSLDPNDCSRPLDESNQESCADQVVSQ